METTLMENQMEKKTENEIETSEYIGVILLALPRISDDSYLCWHPASQDNIKLCHSARRLTPQYRAVGSRRCE